MYGPGALLANRYRLDERVGGGGMGEVWRATDEVLGRTVAVKLMRPELLEEPGFAQRFLFEARTMATIKHSGVVAIHDYRGDDEAAFLVMEYVEGEALARRLHRFGRLDPNRTMTLLAQAADALQAAHDKGVVHRDIKPGNLLVTADDQLILTDFGIARSAASTPLTATGAVVGTPSYIAPEQVLGKPATARSDLYALGVVAYECLTGRRPFDGDNPFEVAMKRLHEPAPTIGIEAPVAVLAVVERALAADPEERWPSAAELAAAARQAIAAPDRVDTPATKAAPAANAAPTATPDSRDESARPDQSAAAPTSAEPAGYASARVPVPEQSSPMPPTTIDHPPPSPRPPPATAPPPAPYYPTPPPVAQPAWPGRPVRPVSLFLANLLLSVTGLCLLAYALSSASVMGAVVDEVTGFYGRNHEAVASTQLYGWLTVAALGVLGCLMLLLAALNHRGSRGARVWTFVLGFATLCCCAPTTVLGDLAWESMQAEEPYAVVLTAGLPDWYEPLLRFAGWTGVGALLLALILLMVPPTNRYFRFFRPPPRAPYYYYPYYGYPPRR